MVSIILSETLDTFVTNTQLAFEGSKEDASLCSESKAILHLSKDIASFAKFEEIKLGNLSDIGDIKEIKIFKNEICRKFLFYLAEEIYNNRNIIESQSENDKLLNLVLKFVFTEPVWNTLIDVARNDEKEVTMKWYETLRD